MNLKSIGSSITNKFHPPAYIPTEAEHRLAYYRTCLDDVWDMVIPLYNPWNDDYSQSREAMSKELKRIVLKWDENIHSDKKSEDFWPWEVCRPYEQFKKELSNK